MTSKVVRKAYLVDVQVVSSGDKSQISHYPSFDVIKAKNQQKMIQITQYDYIFLLASSTNVTRRTALQPKRLFFLFFFNFSKNKK